MPNQGTTLASVEKTAIRLAQELGYEWIDLELVKEPAGRFLRFFIDKEGGITLDDVEAFHRRIQPFAENVDYDYMEVSSPGIDRPLKKEKDFERAKGFEIEVRLYKPLDGQKVYEGELVGLIDGKIVIGTPDGEKAFDQKAVAVARRVINVDEELLSSAFEEDGEDE
ncbi:MAG: ribosome maturation factor RimP [Clostridia bacterium]|nr:ribosome maturation factor RimP [Clostridia bacterium]